MRTGQKRHVAYRNLADRLRKAIRRGDFDDGRPLPTEEKLASVNDLSRQTVRRALQELVAEGAVYRVAGRGTFALPRRERFISDFESIEDLLTLTSATTVDLISPLRRAKEPASARQLRLADDEVMTLTVLRLHDGVPFGLTVVCLPPAIGALLKDEKQLRTPGKKNIASILGLIEKRKAGLIANTEQSVTAIIVPREVARHLKTQADKAFLKIERLYLDRDNTPVEFAVSYFDPDYYTYRVRLRRERA